MRPLRFVRQTAFHIGGNAHANPQINAAQISLQFRKTGKPRSRTKTTAKSLHAGNKAPKGVRWKNQLRR
jgi:hypothetical protein